MISQNKNHLFGMRRIIFSILFFSLGVFASDIERALLAEPPSAEEMVRRGRALLLKSLHRGDSAVALQTISFLDEKYSAHLCPFSRMEKGLAYLRVGRYDSAWTSLVRERRLFAPQARNAESDADRCAVGSTDGGEFLYFYDELFSYLRQDFTWTAPKMDSLFERVRQSSAGQFYKDAIPAFFPVALSFPQEPGNDFRNFGEAFVQKYPYDENGIWLRENFLRNRDVVAENSDDVLRAHLYGNGVGFEFLTGVGFLTSDFKENFRHKYGEFFVGLPIQISRLTFTPFISFGRLETRKNVQFDDVLWEKGSELALLQGGMTLGFVAWDSRFFKAEPFVGIASAEMVLPEDSRDYYYFADKPNNNYHRLKRYVESNNSIACLWGVSGEFRLLSFCPRRAKSPITSISLRLKYMASVLDHDLGYRTLEGFSHRILAGIGFFIW